MAQTINIEMNRFNGSDYDTLYPVNGAKRPARVVVGTSENGWTLGECDYLCDGIDDQVEIQEALNRLDSFMSGEVIILDGVYNITDDIIIPEDNITVKGSGNGTVLKRMYDSVGYNSAVIVLSEKSYCKIENLYIDGNKADYNSSYNKGIYTVIGAYNTINNNTIRNSYGGIVLSNTTNSIISNNVCNNSSLTGITLMNNASNNTVSSNICFNNHNGISIVDNSEYSTLIGNVCYGNVVSGIAISDTTENCTITGNNCNNNDLGISLSYAINCTVSGNNCNNNNNIGIQVESSENCTIVGNSCIRGNGQISDYTSVQATIKLAGTLNTYNLITNNNCMGKAVTNEGGTGNTLSNNKFNAT